MLCNVCNNMNNYSCFSYTPKNTVSFRSIYMYLLRKKIFLSRTTGWDFFRESPKFIMSNLVKLQTLMRICRKLTDVKPAT